MVAVAGSGRRRGQLQVGLRVHGRLGDRARSARDQAPRRGDVPPAARGDAGALGRLAGALPDPLGDAGERRALRRRRAFGDAGRRRAARGERERDQPAGDARSGVVARDVQLGAGDREPVRARGRAGARARARGRADRVREGGTGERAAGARAGAGLLPGRGRAGRDPREAVGRCGALRRRDRRDAALEPARAGGVGGHVRAAARGQRRVLGVPRDAAVELKRAADFLLCVVVAAVLIGIVGDGDAAQPWQALGMVAAVVQGVALWWRRSRPEAVMAITLAGGAIVQLVARDGIFPFAALIALGSLTYRRPPRVSVPAAVATLAVTSLAYAGTAPRNSDVSFGMAFPVVVWAMSEAMRNRRQAIAAAAARAAGEEQARLARELHDVIAHSLSVIVVQAGAAGDVFEARPDQARAALHSIEGAGREALGELRRLLAGEQPGLDRLGELAEPLRAAGLEVAIDVDADASPGVEGSAYRIVQEALTNTLRHAGASRAEVVVRAGEGMLELDMRDDGRGGGFADGSGRGIAGMRERAALLGGTLDAGPMPEGGFRVHARLPL